ncbi:hypothetical protein AMTRI_Chr10g7420 [Amborella trichopoda]
MVYFCTFYHDLGFYMYFLCIFMKIVLPWHCLLCNASDKKSFFLENRKFISFSFICASICHGFIQGFASLCSFCFLIVSITLYLYSGKAIIY